MQIIDVNNMRAEEQSNNSSSDGYPIFDNTASYNVSDYVEYDGKIYYSLVNTNQGNDPKTAFLEWQTVKPTNRLAMYDISPNFFSKRNGGSFTSSWNVQGVDAIYIGNIYGASIVVDFNGTETKIIDNGRTSLLSVWGLDENDNIDGVGYYYKEFSSLQNGTLSITVTLKAGASWAGIGFINYGKKIDLGCTLLSENIRYNMKSGVEMTGKVSELERLRKSSFREIILPIRIQQQKDVAKIINELSRYSGFPMLVIGDDVGKEENIFYGVYSSISATFGEQFGYTISIRSLDYEAFTPPTELELKEEEANKEDIISLKETIFCLKDTSTTNGKIKGVIGEVFGYYDGLSIAVVPLNDTTSTTTININGYGEIPLEDPTNILKSDKVWFLKYDSTTPSFKMCNLGLPKPTITGKSTGIAPLLSEFDDTTIIQDRCSTYYKSGGAVVKCLPNVSSKNGIPIASDFTSNIASQVIFNTSSIAPLKGYVRSGTTIKEVCFKSCDYQGQGNNPSSTRGDGSALVNGDSYYLSTASRMLYWNDLNNRWVVDGQKDLGNSDVSYCGTLSSDPSSRYGGGALKNGDMYYSTADDAWRYYKGGTWGGGDTIEGLWSYGGTDVPSNSKKYHVEPKDSYGNTNTAQNSLIFDFEAPIGTFVSLTGSGATPYVAVDTVNMVGLVVARPQIITFDVATLTDVMVQTAILKVVSSPCRLGGQAGIELFSGADYYLSESPPYPFQTYTQNISVDIAPLP